MLGPVRKMVESGKSRRVNSKKVKFSKQAFRREHDASAQAVFNLRTNLRNYELTNDKRNSLQNEMSRLEPIATMNMDYLAAALYILSSIVPEPSTMGEIYNNPNLLNEQNVAVSDAIGILNRHFGPLDPNTKRKEVLLTYIITVVLFRERRGGIVYEQNESAAAGGESLEQEIPFE